MIIPNVTILVLWASQGLYNYGMGIDKMVTYWDQYLKEKEDTDPQWPFHTNVELVDYESNITYCTEFLDRRLQELPIVSAIMSPEGHIGTMMASLASHYNIPYLTTSTNPDPIVYALPPNETTSFYIESPSMYTFRALFDTYLEVGVKSMVTVAYVDDSDAGYNYWSCYGSAQYLGVPRGIAHIAHYNIYSNGTVDDIVSIIRRIKRSSPDAILWCDWQSCTFNDVTSSNRYPLKTLKKENYVPKTFTLLDCFGSPYTSEYLREGLVDYIVQPSFTHPNLKGQEYTEDLQPYANAFRAKSPMTTVLEAMNFGSSTPSSVNLFSHWFLNVTGTYPTYQSNGYWAALDILETALYRVATNKNMMRKGIVDPNDVFTVLLNAQTSGMYGRVVFDANRVNTPTPTIVIQLFPGKLNPDIVSPPSQKTMTLIYPMPNWYERQYSWSLTKDVNFTSSIVIASLCSTLLLAMMITLFIHRNQGDIRMLHWSHMVSVCGSCLIVIWGSVFLWQSDMNSLQCRMFPWFIYLPLSFAVMMMNMKAYRLSVFLHSDDKHRLKRLTHRKILILTLGWTSCSVVTLLLLTLFSPPKLVEVVMDSYRPFYNIHSCSWSSNASVIIYLLVIGHFIFSVSAVIGVRNGTGEFRDGMVLKEAFVLFWICMALAYMIQLLGLDASTTYVGRSACLSVGVAIFCFRLLVSRCYRHWMPLYMIILLNKIWIMISNIVTVERKTSVLASISLLEDIEGPGYADEEPALEDMQTALKDPERTQKFRQFAEKALVVENVDFLLAVQKYRKTSAEMLSECSKTANDRMKELAMKCFYDYMEAGCDNEVNVSSACRNKTNTQLKDWEEKKSLLNDESAEDILNDDMDNRVDVFERAAKEISIMLYQNIWEKFRHEEIESTMI
jgi:hypothetical protein